MVFSFTIFKLINTVVLCIGLGVCGLNWSQLHAAKTITDKFKGTFQLFFTLLSLFIAFHLLRDILDGHPGNTVRVCLFTVSTLEALFGFLTTIQFSRILMYSVYGDTRNKAFEIILLVLSILYVTMLIFNLPYQFMFTFDEGNGYARGQLHYLSNVLPTMLLIADAVFLLICRKRVNHDVRPALWIYIIAPTIAIILQTLFYGLQLIIFVTIAASVYIFIVFMRAQNDAFEQRRKDKILLENELHLASSIQNNMLPNVFPAFPDREEFDIYACMNPAKEVGGDFYDFFLIDDTHLAIVIADVSGKGVPASLFMMISMTLIQNNSVSNTSPKAVLESVNRQLCLHNVNDMFVTVWLGILDLKTGVLKASNAGHEYPVLCKPGEEFMIHKEKHGIALGAIDTARYSEYDMTLEPGSKLFVYTDGVPEATNNEEELFGVERMLDALNSDTGASPEKILGNVNSKVSEFVGSASQFDDLTMLCLEFKDYLHQD